MSKRLGAICSLCRTLICLVTLIVDVTTSAIGNMGARAAAAIPALTVMLDDKKTSLAATTCLMRIGAPAAAANSKLIGVLEKHDLSSAYAAKALASIKNAEAIKSIPEIIPLLSSSDDRICTAVV